MDDDRINQHLIQTWMREMVSPHRVVSSHAQARAALQERPWDIVMAGLNVGVSDDGCSGLDLLKEARALHPQAALVLMTAHGGQSDFSRAVSLGLDRVLLKPFRRAEFFAALEALDQLRQTREALRLARDALRQKNEELEMLREQEHRLGAMAQKYLLFQVPTAESIPGLTLHSANSAQDGASGDILDVLQRDGCLDIVIGDVMGKGLGAAIISAAIKTALAQVCIAHPSLSAEATVQTLRQLIEPMLHEINSLLTLMLARIDISASMLRVVDCGAPRLMLERAFNQQVVFAHGELMPIGVSSEKSQAFSLPLYPGDRLFFVSDGVLDAIGLADVRAAYGQLADKLQSHPCQSGATLAQLLVNLPREESGVADDRTCVVVCCNLPAPHRRKTARIKHAASLEALHPMRRWAEKIVRQWLTSTDHLNALNRDSRSTTSRLSPAPDPAGASESRVLALDDWMSRFLLGISEVATNIIKHALANTGGDRSFDLQLTLDAPTLWVEWHYEGNIYEPLLTRTDHLPDQDFKAETGYGLSIIDQVFDSTLYFTGIPRGQTIISRISTDIYASISTDNVPAAVFTESHL